MRVPELPWSGDKMIVQTLGSGVPESMGEKGWTLRLLPRVQKTFSPLRVFPWHPQTSSKQYTTGGIGRSDSDCF